MHISIKMSFGLMTNKWQVVQYQKVISISHSSEIIMATSRHHKLIILEDSNNDIKSILVGLGSPLNWGTVPQQIYV